MESNWSTVKLKEVLEQVIRPEEVMPGEHYKVLGAKWYAKGLFIKSEKDGSEIKAKKLYVVKEGDFVYNRLFAWKGSFAIVPNEFDGCYVSNEFPSFRIDTKQIHLRYLLYFFSRNEIWSEVLSLSMGVSSISRNRLKVEKLISMEIPLPSLEEQKRIVAKIESFLAKIEEVRRLRTEAVIEVEKTIKSILGKIFLNDGWITDKLGNVCDTTSGGTPSRERPDFFNGEIAWLKSGELKDTLIVDSEERITEEGLQNSNAKIFMKGTLLIALYGATTGKTGILDIDAATNQAICAIFPNKNIIERAYLHWFLRFKRDDYLFKSFGGAQPNISQKLLKETKISIPPLHEQRRIVAYLDSLQVKVDELKRLQAETEKELEELVPSILDKAFKGEL
ncbi:type I restriction enzyme, S subunit [Candidatus Methanophagaceae archaeon]|nr:type I restriction enzyme, S subunit [Methanophagales archaeon]